MLVMSIKNNPRITAKEKGLLKGALRRVFSRSELRLAALDLAEIEHFDLKRKRVKRWVLCADCEDPCPRYAAKVDHIDPVIKLESSFDEQGLDLTVDRMWCDLNNLQTMHPECHKIKTFLEKKLKQSITIESEEKETKNE